MDAASSQRRVARPVGVIFLGPPGAGKGTQAARLAAHLEVPRISTGDMLRDAIAEGSPLGKGADPLMERGELVPDDLLIALIRERITQEDCARGFVLDGFPRTLAQARGLGEMGLGDLSSWSVFEVEVPREELLRRLSGRRWCPKCQATYHVTSSPPKKEGVCDRDGTTLVQREDDKEMVVARRLREYDERTAPLVAYYRDRAHVHTIDGNRAMRTVFEDLKAAVEISV
ncbi:MAG: adenylate kinase [Vicinamibacteria bacterium]